MKKPIPPLDLLFYAMESHDNPKHVAGLQIFQLPKNASPTFLLDLVEALRGIEAVEPFNFKPTFPRIGMPQWREVPELEMAYHLRHSALPKPGNMQQLITVVQRLHSGMLDRERPGWICHIIEGLENNQFAMYSKIHHAYIDGMSGVRRMYGALNQDSEDQNIIPLWGYQAALEEKPGAGQQRKRRKPGLGRNLLKQGRAMAEVSGQVLKIGLELASLRQPSGHIPFRAPRTKINRMVPSDLRSMGVTSMPLDLLKGVGKQVGCTVNEVVLTLIDAALHDYLGSHGDEPNQPLVAMCPMSLREKGDTTANTQVATLLIELGQSRATLRQRLQQVAKSSSGSKTEAREMSRQALIDFVLVVGGAFEVLQRTGLDRVVPQSYNVLVSNVPGPDGDEMYLRGARMLASYPISTLTPGNNLNVTVLSHGNRLDFGLLAAAGTLPDIDYLVQRLDAQFEALSKEFGAAVNALPKRKAMQKATAKPAARAKTARRKKTTTRRTASVAKTA